MSLKSKINQINDLFNAPKTTHQKAWGFIYDFYHIILTVMEENKISRAELAKRLGVSRSAVTQLLNDSPNLTIKRMVEIADAVEIELVLTTIDRNWFGEYTTKSSSKNQYLMDWYKQLSHPPENLVWKYSWTALASTAAVSDSFTSVKTKSEKPLELLELGGNYKNESRMDA